MNQVNTINTGSSPAEMFRMALENGADLAKIAEFMNLQERYEANLARKAFNEAMAAFREEVPKIDKNAEARYDGKLQYKFAKLDHILDIVVPIASKHGLYHQWTIGHTPEGITVTCHIRHKLGHSESVTSPPVAPDTSGKKNPIQATGSSISYMEKYTLMAAYGLATEEQDDDGNSAATSEVTRRFNECESLDSLKATYQELFQWARALNDKGEMMRLVCTENDRRKKELM